MSDTEDTITPIRIRRTDTLSIIEKQNITLQKYRDNIDNILTPDQKQKYCLIFGSTVFHEFDTYDKAKIQRNTDHLCYAMWCPKRQINPDAEQIIYPSTES